jgi:hypothetical protein
MYNGPIKAMPFIRHNCQVVKKNAYHSVEAKICCVPSFIPNQKERVCPSGSKFQSFIDISRSNRASEKTTI